MFSFLIALHLVLIGLNSVLLSTNAHRAEPIWRDEFETLDRNTWKHLITGWRGGNNEFQYYNSSDENSYVREGILYIKPTLTADRFGNSFLESGVLDLNKDGCNFDLNNGCLIRGGGDIVNPIQSARIVTKESFSFIYGTVEVRAKMPKGDWIWPAIWMLPTDNFYGNYPRSGEIDIVESRGNKNLVCGQKKQIRGRQLVASALHWGLSSKQMGSFVWEKRKKDNANDFSSDFHVYRMEWRPDGFRFFIDDESVGDVSPPQNGFWELGKFKGTNNIWKTKMAPFDQRFHLVMNVAVGGNFFPDDCINEIFAKPWNQSDRDQMRKFWAKKDQWYPTWNAHTEDNAMQVDWIRIYKNAGSNTASSHILLNILLIFHAGTIAFCLF